MAGRTFIEKVNCVFGKTGAEKIAPVFQLAALALIMPDAPYEAQSVIYRTAEFVVKKLVFIPFFRQRKFTAACIIDPGLDKGGHVWSIFQKGIL